MQDRVVIAIPARHASTRLPGKPLLEIAGKPLILHVVDRALAVGDVEVVVATDDRRIADVVEAAGIRVAMTLREHPSGSDRLAEVARLLDWPDETIVVNLQGDEPLMPVSCLRRVAEALREDPDAAAATLATPIATVEEMLDPACVKVVLDRRQRALYFSRAPIPWPRDLWAGDPKQLSAERPWRHVGLYAYRARTLMEFSALGQGKLEAIESLEQLRLLENGLPIVVQPSPEPIPPGVDTPADFDRVSRILASTPNANLRRVLFVCMGNICRSPLAEAYARSRFEQLGLRVDVESAGTIGHHQGQPADRGALAIAAIEGLELRNHRARRVRDDDFSRFDLILALDEHNLHDLRGRVPRVHADRLRLLLDFAPGSGHRGVPDPYGESQEVFAHSLALIKAGVDGLAAHLASGA